MNTPTDCALLVGVEVESIPKASGPPTPGLLSLSPKTRSHLRQVLIDCEQLGAIVPRGVRRLSSEGVARTSPQFSPVTLAQIAEVSRSHRVLILLTHHDVRAGFQLGTAFVTPSELGQTIGQQFDGAIDLGVCETADEALEAIRATCPRSRCTANRLLHGVDARASIIRAAMRTLAHTPRPYIHAIADVLEEIQLQSLQRRT